MVERFVGGAPRVRWMVVVTGTLMVALVLPSGGSAQGQPKSAQRKAPPELLDSAAINVNHGFKLSLGGGTRELVDSPNHGASPVQRPGPVTGFNAATARQRQSIFLDAGLAKVSGKGIGRVTQSADYLFTSGITFKGSSNLKTAKIAGTLLHNRGQVTLTFTASGPAQSIPVPKGCTGSAGARRNGTLHGTFVLKADKLGKERLSSVRAGLVRPPNIKSCSPGGGGPHGVELLGYVNGASSSFDVGAQKLRGRRFVSEDLEEQRYGSGFNFEYRVSVNAPRSKYTYASDLSYAELKGYGPIKGSATYFGNAQTNGQSTGMLSGDLSATNAAIGKIRPLSNATVNAFQTQS